MILLMPDLLLLLLPLLLAMEAAPPWILLSKGLIWWQCIHLDSREGWGGDEDEREDEDWQLNEDRILGRIRMIRIRIIRIRMVRLRVIRI